MRQCQRDIACYSDPQSTQEYETLMKILFLKGKQHRLLEQDEQEINTIVKIVKLARVGLPPTHPALPKALLKLGHIRKRIGQYQTRKKDQIDLALEHYKEGKAPRLYVNTYVGDNL